MDQDVAVGQDIEDRPSCGERGAATEHRVLQLLERQVGDLAQPSQVQDAVHLVHVSRPERAHVLGGLEPQFPQQLLP